MTLTALGIVYGDIGTSPLYALKQAADSAGGVTRASVTGLVSLIFWALILIISVKYAILILRADNRGEGGIVAMLALLDARHAKAGSWQASLLVVGLVGAALLYGDGAITPAISVLSAIEGLKLDAPKLAPAVVPLTVAILIGLFMVQRRGTAFVGAIFGPVMLLWFVAIGVLGIGGILRNPAILTALNPWMAASYLTHAGAGIAFAVLGAAFLAVTGGEAMYADMGHFGRAPMRAGWFGVVLPALTLNYFGQGGLLLADPRAAENPFYYLAPRWAHYPLVVFATLATIIASQAIISGAYSLTQQAIQLGFLPRMRVLHTASQQIGQIYMPVVNWALAAGTIGAVVGFGSSDALGGGVRDRGFHADGDHHHACGVDRPEMGVSSAGGAGGERRFPGDRSDLRGREPHEDRCRRMVSPAVGRDGCVHHADLAHRMGASGEAARQAATA